MHAKTAIYDSTITELERALTPGASPGTFTAVVAVFGNVDRVGDRITDTAFDASLKRWRASGDRIPVVWSHEYKDVHAVIGWADPFEVEAVAGVGLVATAHFLDSEPAQAVRDLMSEKAVTSFSFGYRIIRERRGADGANELMELDLLEFGPTLVPANEATHLLAVKSADELAEARAKARAEADAMGKALLEEYTARVDAEEKALGAGIDTTRVDTFLAELEHERQAEEAAAAAAAEKADADQAAADVLRLADLRATQAVARGDAVAMVVDARMRPRSVTLTEQRQHEETKALESAARARHERETETAKIEAVAAASRRPASVLGMAPRVQP
jgi:HK97 family phage prohead protease